MDLDDEYGMEDSESEMLIKAKAGNNQKAIVKRRLGSKARTPGEEMNISQAAAEGNSIMGTSDLQMVSIDRKSGMKMQRSKMVQETEHNISIQEVNTT